MSGITYYYGDVDGHADAIRNRANNLEALQRDINRQLNDIADFWGGKASDSFLLTLKKLNDSFGNIHAAASEHAQRVRSANANMHSTDGGIASTWM